MYVTLKLSRGEHTDEQMAQLQALSKGLHKRLGVFYDGLLVTQKVSDRHASVLDVHTSGARPGRQHIGEQLARLATEYTGEQVMFGWFHTHVGGIRHDFADGWLKVGY